MLRTRNGGGVAAWLALFVALVHGAAAAHPLSNPQPSSNILAPGTSSVTLGVSSAVPTSCAYAVGSDRPFAQMTPFATGAGTTSHHATIAIDPSPSVVNDVYVRCAAQPDSVLHLVYRSRAAAQPSFPRIGNLWGWGEWTYGDPHTIAQRARVDLWLGADVWDMAYLSQYRDDFRQLRTLNPDALILASMNAVEPYTSAIPESYYLHDVNGHRIEVWPGSYRLNLTRPEVADFQANWGYRRLADAGFIHDGLFVDNVFLSQSWQTTDIYGNPVQIDADEDHVADLADTLDAHWRAGVLREVETLRALMPDIVLSGHALEEGEPRILAAFNSLSIGFEPANVIEGEETYGTLAERYRIWDTAARAPRVNMIEGSPIDLFAYGYDYDPLTHAKPSSVAFARGFYPWMRFGLGLTLLRDGYYAYEWGDTYHGNAWWYDEYDFDLGQPLGAATNVAGNFDPGPNRIENPGFELALGAPWTWWVDTGSGYAATVTRDATAAHTGAASLRVDVTQTAGTDWRVDVHQENRTLVAGTPYVLTFWAKAASARTLAVAASKGSPNWDGYGLSHVVSLGTAWQEYQVPFVATASASDARIQFFFGATTGTVWVDDVQLVERAPDVLRRDFTHGSVVVNATARPRVVTMPAGFRRLAGAQAPRVQRILDDADSAFTTPTGAWTTRALDSGEWKATGPFFHGFGASSHWLAAGAGTAEWTLPIDAGDTYTLNAWWPAAPESSAWAANARYDLLVNGAVVSSQVLDQRSGGDAWRRIGTAGIPTGASVKLRLTCPTGTCVADAIEIESQARYNDGTAAHQVSLQPFDAIVLRADPGAGVEPLPGIPGLRFTAIAPNPSRTSVRFAFVLPASGPVQLRVFDVDGRMVAEPLRGVRPAGPVDVTWGLHGRGGRPLAPGIYLAQVSAAGRRVSQRFSIVR